MGDTRRSHLVFLEVDRNVLLDPQVLQVVFDKLVGLLLVEFLSLGFQVLGHRAVLFQEAVDDLLGDFHVLAVWLVELLQELRSESCILVLELRVDLEVALEEHLVTLLQILRQRVVQGL